MHIATPSIHVLDWLGTLWQARRSITTRVSHPSIHTLETLILSANHVQNVQRKNNLNGNGFWWSEYRQRSQHTYLLLPYTCTFCLIDVTPPLISLEWHHKKNTPSIHLFDWCGTSSDKPGVASLEEYTIHPHPGTPHLVSKLCSKSHYETMLKEMNCDTISATKGHNAHSYSLHALVRLIENLW